VLQQIPPYDNESRNPLGRDKEKSLMLKKQLPTLIIIEILLLILIITAIALSSCSQLLASAQGSSSNPQSGLISIPGDATATPTPFMPLAPTATSAYPLFPTATPLHSPTPTLYAIPNTTGGTVQQSSSAYIPAPAVKIEQPANQINILILGSDQRAYTGGFRTDTILLVTVNFELKKINMTSFPRDLYVYLPGYYQERINTAQFKGGFPLTAATFEYNFGVRPDYYVMLNFSGFKNIIDMLGGIEVNAAQQLTDQRDGYGYYTVYPGINHMNGETALWYVRARYTSSDFDRTRRQQEVMLAVIDRMISLEMIPKIPDLYNEYKNTVSTDLALEDIVPLVPLASEFLQGNIGRYNVGRAHVTPWVTHSGSQVLLPNTAAIQAVLRAALNAD
jgi:LCP family protein required for cell wall assembly